MISEGGHLREVCLGEGAVVRLERLEELAVVLGLGVRHLQLADERLERRVVRRANDLQYLEHLHPRGRTRRRRGLSGTGWGAGGGRG